MGTAEPAEPAEGSKKGQGRGTVRNTNGLLRQFFPKGMDLGRGAPAEVQRVESLLNNRPRKCLGYRTPPEVLRE